MPFKFTKNEIILYLNYIYLTNQTILDLYEKTGLEDFFDKDRAYYDFLTDKVYGKIFDKERIEAFRSYLDLVYEKDYKYVTMVDEAYPKTFYI